MALNDAIKLVSGDNLPIIQLVLKDEFTGAPIDIAASSTTVNVLFRPSGNENTLATLPCTKTGAPGAVRFNFPGSSLAVPAGLYDGAIVISFNGNKQTVYDMLKFRVRNA